MHLTATVESPQGSIIVGARKGRGDGSPSPCRGRGGGSPTGRRDRGSSYVQVGCEAGGREEIPSPSQDGRQWSPNHSWQVP